MIEVVLLKSFKNLGKANSLVKVKRGFANNYLIPFGYALVANKNILLQIEKNKEQIAKQDEQSRQKAKSIHSSIDGKSIVVIKQCSEDGSLYGSLAFKEVSDELVKINLSLNEFLHKNSVRFASNIKTTGKYRASLNIYDDIDVFFDLIIARNQEEVKTIMQQAANASKAGEANGANKEQAA
jgi:large subunit ribosomal protein L9